MGQRLSRAVTEKQPECRTAPDPRPGLRIFAVIPLYGIMALESAGFRTLRIAASYLAPELGDLRILLYDNTPGAVGGKPPILPGYVDCHASCRNDGLAAAYNFALEQAQRDKCEWLITLDQDTEVPPDFLTRVATIAHAIRNESSIAAIVPQLIGDGRMLSPNWFWAGAVPRWFPKGYIGIPSHPTFAFNSGSMLRISALRQIRGYSQWFWLDNCDSYLFHRLHSYGKRVFVAGDIQVGHEFSMLDQTKRMSILRYHNILMAETAFWDISMNRLAGCERTLRLIGRWCKTAFDSKSQDLRGEAARAIKRRLFVSRRRRIEEWKGEMEAERPWLNEKRAHEGEAGQKISFCMATYNGERFVVEQLASILPQLAPEDEVVVIDDKSSDSTSELVAGFGDARIRLIEHQERQGVVCSFEDAVRSASGDILFLCDQDDIWAPDKVSR